MTYDWKRANVTFKTDNKGERSQLSVSSQCLGTVEQIPMEIIHTYTKDKQAAGNKQHGSTKAKWCLPNLTAPSDEIICSGE